MKENCLKKYNQLFVRDYNGPVGIQYPQKNWFTRKQKVSDFLIKKHLDQKYSVALPGSWYPYLFRLDVDFNIRDAILYGKIISEILDILELEECQYWIMTSPSYKKNGANCHILLHLTYRGNLPTLKLGRKFLLDKVGHLCEVYPQANRLCRLPLGRDQFLVSHEGFVRHDLHWVEAMHLIEKLEPLHIPPPESNKIFGSGNSRSKEINLNFRKDEVEQLINDGLNSYCSRHISQWRIILYKLRQNWIPDDVITFVQAWIRKNHNGYSKEINTGNQHIVDQEIIRQVEWVYNQGILPDKLDKTERALTASDILFAIEKFKGDVINQKRLIKLVGYYRLRQNYQDQIHDEVFIPYHIWHSIAGKNEYKDFIKRLIEMKLLYTDWKYRHNQYDKFDSYCRKFKLFGLKDNENILELNGRNLTSYYESILYLTGNNVREASALTGIPTQRFYHYLKNNLLSNTKQIV